MTFERTFYSKTLLSTLLLLVITSLFVGCTTYQTQMGSQATSFYNNQSLDTTTIAYSVILTGNAANTLNDEATPNLNSLKKRLENASENSSLVFLGDNIYPTDDSPIRNLETNVQATEKIKKQLDLSQKFKGSVFMIPGKADWGYGLNGLLSQEKIIQKYPNKKSELLPKNGCGIESKSLSPTVELITIDSQWFMEDWDKHPEINNGCTIKTREQFFEAFETMLLQNQQKTIVLAMHHPIFSNGVYGGNYSLKQQLFPFDNSVPLPIVGSFINLIRKASGYNSQDIQNIIYSALVQRIKITVQKYDNILVVSGHENNMQYSKRDGIQQIISGSGAYVSPAKAVEPTDFSYGGFGYAVLDVYANGASTISYYTTINRKEVLLFKQKTREPQYNSKNESYPKIFEATKETSVFGKSVIERGPFYKFLWGNHYKKYYQQQILVQTATLDTLYGGLKPIGLDTENTTGSLYFSSKKGKQYVMVPLQKDAASFFNSLVYKNQLTKDKRKNELTESFLMDYFTAIHPFMPLVLPDLSKAIGVQAMQPELLYIPKHKVLENYNENFGDALYYLSEKPANSIGTDAMLHLIHTNKSHQVDTQNYLRARLLDMLIGDWDRNAENWQWSVHQEQGKTIYRPIPLNRDQAFAKYDGTFLGLLKSIPAMGQMQSYSYNLKQIKKFNLQAYTLDLALLADCDEKTWLDQVQFIKENLTNEQINQAFANLPSEIKDETTSTLKMYLKNRLDKLDRSAKSYHKLLEKKGVVVGTLEDDVFVINRLSGGRTTVVVYNGKKVPGNIVFEKTFSKKHTKEIWLFGLEGKDEFSMEGSEFKNIKIRMIGGLNQDSYVVENGKNVKIHDFMTNNSSLTVNHKTTVLLSNDYETNTYNYKRPKFNQFSAIPLVGYNPDDGIRLGAKFDYTQNGFVGNPISQKHTATARYFFATEGYDLNYSGYVKKIIHKYDLVIDAMATSSNFVQNFFGYGNETGAFKEEGLDYNRVRIAMLKVNPGLSLKGKHGSMLTARLNFESYEVEDTPNRYISENTVNPSVFERQSFAGIGVAYDFKNYDNFLVPTLGLGFHFSGYWNTNISDFAQNVPMVQSQLNLVYKLIPSAQWVFETTLRTKSLFGTTYEFYQAASVGGDYDLRGFRENRFTGRTAFTQTSDIRYSIGQIKNPFAPVTYGAFVGFDYGRVWIPTENSDKWHTSTGIGIWFTSSNFIASKVSYFYSEDGGRIAFGMKFNF